METRQEKWMSKRLRVRWDDGNFTDFPVQSSEHWNRLKAFYEHELPKQRKEKGRKVRQPEYDV